MPVDDNKTAINTNICLLWFWMGQVCSDGVWAHLRDIELKNTNTSPLRQTKNKPAPRHPDGEHHRLAAIVSSFSQQMVSKWGHECVWHEWL